MGVLAPIVQIFVLPVLSCLHRLPVCKRVAAKFVGDQHPWPVALFLQKFPEEPGRSLSVPLVLDQYFEDVPVLIDGTPQIFSDSTDFDEHFVEMPLVPGLRLMSVQPAGVLGPELRAPGADRLGRTP